MASCMSGFTKTSALVFKFLIIFGCLSLAGCATYLRQAVPVELIDQAQVSHFQDIRFWGDEELPNLHQLAEVRRKQIMATRPQSIRSRRIELLAISGGGADGAFGAGFLNGWTKRGTRPEFEVVTGVSTGALIAPFAFLGPAYDAQLKEIYTQYSTNDILEKEIVSALLGNTDALANSKPMFALISHYIDMAFLRAVAREHSRGRRLLIGTTNLDAGRPVMWNMGSIASQGSAEALDLFRRIMLASASIPGVFPPVFIKVEAGNKIFEEMHVDGGVTDNAFLLPAHFDAKKFDPNYKSNKVRLYAIVNDKLIAPPKAVKNSIYAIAGRSLSTLIRQQTEGDLLKLYVSAKRNNIDFNMAVVPYQFDFEAKEAFDKDYMQALYKLGFQTAVQGYQWRKTPPGY